MAYVHLAESQADLRAEMSQASHEIARALRQTADTMERCATTQEPLDHVAAQLFEVIATMTCELAFTVTEVADVLNVGRA